MGNVELSKLDASYILSYWSGFGGDVITQCAYTFGIGMRCCLS